MAGLDTGYTAAKTKEILRNMYKNKTTSIDSQSFHYLLFKYTDTAALKTPNLFEWWVLK